MKHICVSKLTIIGSDNGLSPGRRQAIIWTNARILLIGTLGTNFNEILSEIDTFSFKKMYLKISSAKWRPFCLGLNQLTERRGCQINPINVFSEYPVPSMTPTDRWICQISKWDTANEWISLTSINSLQPEDESMKLGHDPWFSFSITSLVKPVSKPMMIPCKPWLVYLLLWVHLITTKLSDNTTKV